MNIYIDESGNLGFTEKSTKYFIAVFILIENPEATSTSIRKLLRELHKNKLYTGSELKFSKSSQKTRTTTLEKLLKIPWNAGLIILEKQKVSPKLREKSNILYNYCIVNNVIKKIMLQIEPNENINIIIDRSLSKTNRDAFNQYVKTKANWVWQIELEKQTPLKPNQIKTIHQASHHDPCLQLADYVAGATFQKYERNDPRYYTMIEDRIIAFTYLW